MINMHIHMLGLDVFQAHPAEEVVAWVKNNGALKSQYVDAVLSCHVGQVVTGPASLGVVSPTLLAIFISVLRYLLVVFDFIKVPCDERLRCRRFR